MPSLTMLNRKLEYENKLPMMDSNHLKGFQRPVCCHYTNGEGLAERDVWKIAYTFFGNCIRVTRPRQKAESAGFEPSDHQ